jgi:hypothetical protein
MWPALVNRFETVTVGIENVRSVITGITTKERRASGFTRRFFNNSAQRHTFFESAAQECQGSSGRVVPVYQRSNQRLLEAEVGIERGSLYRSEPNTLCYKANASHILQRFKSHSPPLIHRCALSLYRPPNAQLVQLQVKFQV